MSASIALLACGSLFAIALGVASVRADDAVASYAEKLRPQFHFSSSTDWINDPNGLVFYEGEYHLFFQRVPGSNDGNTITKSWGHAVSTDLVHWKQSPKDAISPDEAGSIWSGSAVVDWNNTSGFGVDGKPPLIALYTRMDEKNQSDQRLAYSTDRGRTWTKYDKSVLPHIHGINRDPKVIWHEPTKRWVMALYLDRRSHFTLFTSPNLKDWTHLQDVTLETDDECPDFFPLNLDGDAARQKWIYTGANGKYVVGSFDGNRFTPESDVLIGDHGNGNFYAAQTYSDAPDGRRIQIAWFRDGKFPGMPFNQQLSFPCELTLRSTPRGPRLFKWPVKEIESLHSTKRDAVADVQGDLFDISVEIAPGSLKETTLTVRGFPITFHPEGAAGALTAWDRRVALSPTNGPVKLRVLVDHTSIEIFANGGETVLSGCFLPKDDQRGITLTSDENKSATVSVVELKSAWPQPGDKERR